MSAKKTKTRLLVTLSDQVKDKLQTVSVQSGAPMAEIVRRAITEFLAKSKIQ